MWLLCVAGLLVVVAIVVAVALARKRTSSHRGAADDASSSSSRARHVIRSRSGAHRGPESSQTAVARAILNNLDRDHQQTHPPMLQSQHGWVKRTKRRVTDRILNMARNEGLKWARLQERRLTVGSHEIAYLDRAPNALPGEDNPKTMVLLHGFCGSRDIWIWMAKSIPDEYRVVVLDIPGFGDSSRIAAESYDVAQQAKRIEDFLAALLGPTARIILAGNSMGGNIAARVVLGWPQRVSALVLMNSLGVGSPVMSHVGQEMLLGRNLLLAASVEEFQYLTEIVFVRPPMVPSFITERLAEKIIQHNDFNRKILRDLATHNDDLTPELPKISCPTLIVWGDTDRVLDVSAAAVFQNAIPNSELAIIPSCGHVPMAEQPSHTADLILQFLRRHPAAIATPNN